MKKIISLALAVAMMVIALASCSGSGLGSKSKKTTVTEEQWEDNMDSLNYTMTAVIEYKISYSYAGESTTQEQKVSGEVKQTKDSYYSKSETKGEDGDVAVEESWKEKVDGQWYRIKDNGESVSTTSSGVDTIGDNLESMFDDVDMDFEDAEYDEDEKAYCIKVENNGIEVEVFLYFEGGDLVKVKSEFAMSESESGYSYSAEYKYEIKFNNIGSTKVDVPEFTVPK